MTKPYYTSKDGAMTLWHGDCRDLLPQLSADVIICDPPYNAGKKYGENTDDRRPWLEWCAWWDDVLDLELRAAPDGLAFFSQTTWLQYARHGARLPDWT